MKTNKVKPRIPSGFLELLPEDQAAFDQMLEKIKRVYKLFGFTHIETPAIEFTEVLLAKGGGETEKQIYQLSKEGDDLSMRFDLTVPLARYVAEHFNRLTFPFRRFDTAKVWRGERNQKARFREFYQCDVDVIGTTNVLVDAEIPSIIYNVFKELGFSNFTIKINNRKVLNGFLESLGMLGSSRDILRAIDKLEKQGREKVVEEIKALGVADDSIGKLIDFVNIKGTNDEVVRQLESLSVASDLFVKGVAELKTVAEAIRGFGVPENNFSLDLAIARGLDYYTGTVYETNLDDHPEIGSVCSGGRFDDLAEYYTDQKLPGVGISIGLTRLFYQLKEAGLVQPGSGTPSRVLVALADNRFLKSCIETAAALRQSGINTEAYLENDKIGKQMKYADRLKIPFVVLIGENEATAGKISLKNMVSGEQSLVSLEEAITIIRR